MSVVLLTATFIGLFFILRAMPDAQCGFLHYEEVINADGEIEFCATNHAGFLDLTRLKYPVEIELETEKSMIPDESHFIQMKLETSGGMEISPHELAITHTKKMHVMVIDPSLQDYHHLHPMPDGIGGDYVFSFEPKLSGDYRVFTEIVPIRTRRQVIATSTLSVEGEPNEMEFNRSMVSEVGDIRFELSGPPDVLKTGRDYTLELEVSSKKGHDLILEEIMGARGHMVAFDAARQGFAHMHPIDSISSAQAGLAGLGASQVETPLGFLLNVPNPGWYRLFAQIQIAGEVIFGRFDLLVE